MGLRAERYVVESLRVAHKLWRVRLTPRGASERNPLVAQLAACAVFSSLDDAALDELSEAAIPQAGKRGEALVNENAEWPYIGMVLEGIVARAKGGETRRERILYEVHPNELFGVAEYFDRGLANARIEVFSKSARIVRLHWDIVSDIAARYPALTTALGVVIAQRLRLMNDSLTLQGSLPILARIAGVLLPYAMPGRGLVAASAALSSITQSQIAAAAGTVKEVAARAIAELESREVLLRERGHIRYLDRQRLLDIVRESS
jgi:CRP-like cAMP-binding protein